MLRWNDAALPQRGTQMARTFTNSERSLSILSRAVGAMLGDGPSPEPEESSCV